MSERLRREIARIDPVQCADIDNGYCLVNKKYCCNVTACDIKNPREKVLVSPELTRERQRKAKIKKEPPKAKEPPKQEWLSAQDIEELSKGELTKKYIQLERRVLKMEEIIGAMIERWMA